MPQVWCVNGIRMREFRNWRTKRHSGTLKNVSENGNQAVSVPASAPGPEPSVRRDLPIPAVRPETPAEFGGPQGPEPTRFGDWERNGRCIDF